jgi:hypothetical protein
MYRSLLAGAAVLALGLSTPAFAQSVGVQAGPVAADLSFAPEQRTRIREYVVREKVRPYRERVTVGATLPANVELHTAPAEWGPSVSRYRYVYSNDNVYFVDPGSRRVIYHVD